MGRVLIASRTSGRARAHDRRSFIARATTTTTMASSFAHRACGVATASAAPLGVALDRYGPRRVNAFLLLGLGGLVGVLSGMFGVGGGFLMTPLLFFIGIPPAVAVATEANQIVASSISGVLAHFRRGNVDIKMGMVLLFGGILGSSFGVWLFTILKGIGQIDLVIKLVFGALGPYSDPNLNTVGNNFEFFAYS